ncbi:endoplasmic reticulum-Golgi intermediate compartment protein 2 isoform X2 [Rhodnius prolixus]|uniref:endoplasmic reticulum-Golgi intermediate compartment protein 2 isoform X2 n=1 Tax=Rhodnius prolixus TaxID=13249 RepID=UPI003D18A06D
MHSLVYKHKGTFLSYSSVPANDFDILGRALQLILAISVVTFIIIFWIIIYEIKYYYGSNVNFKFAPDTQFDAKLKLNLDVTVAMPCHSIGADIVDSTNQNLLMFGNLEEEDTWFEMSEEQRSHFEDIRHFNSYLREEYHAINQLLWKSAHSFQPTGNSGFPQRHDSPDQEPDACRIHGSLVLNKIAGNLHITAGKSFQLPDGHIHLPAFILPSSYNFSHRIHHFSFGDSSAGIINPLDGDEKITDELTAVFQYFVEVVPTDVETFLSKANTYQYSVKDHMRIINHEKGSHGVPGIFFKYDVSALKVIVTQSREPLLKFFIRLSSTVAGVFITAGFISSLVNILINQLKGLNESLKVIPREQTVNHCANVAHPNNKVAEEEKIII